MDGVVIGESISAITHVHQVQQREDECHGEAYSWEDTGRGQDSEVTQKRAACGG